jgi:hypothetical protein
MKQGAGRGVQTGEFPRPNEIDLGWSQRNGTQTESRPRSSSPRETEVGTLLTTRANRCGGFLHLYGGILLTADRSGKLVDNESESLWRLVLKRASQVGS